MFNSKFGFLTPTSNAVLTPSFLFNFNGSNGSQVFTYSETNTSISVSVSGNAQNSTTQSKFGGASAYFDGPYIEDPLKQASKIQIDGFASLATADFTIDFWTYITPSAIEDSYFVGQFDLFGNCDWILKYNHTSSNLVFANDSCVINITGSININYNEWTYIAVTRSSNVLRMFVNGVIIGSDNDFPYNISNTLPITIGCDNGGSYGMIGYIDDFRMIKGSALYTMDFSSSLPDTEATL